MAILGRSEFLPQQQRDSIHELAGVRGFDGEFEKSLFVKGVEAKELTPDSRATLMLEAARVQQQVAKARPAYWATVHAMGFGPKGAFAVVDYYPRSAADIIKSGTLLSSAQLYRLIMGTLRGLRDMQQVLGRPHGNLKASNILLSSNDPRQAQVSLCDPAPPRQVASGQAGDDLFALGQIIHQFVLHHPFAGAWPVAPARAWGELGANGRRWRNLCNRLLNPNPEKRPRKLSAVYKRVLKLRPRRSVLLRPIPILLLVVALGAAGIVQRDRIRGWVNEYMPRRVVATTNPVEPVAQEPKHLAMVAETHDQPATAPTTRPGETLAAEAAFLPEYRALYEKRGWTAPAQYLAQLHQRLAATAASDSAARKAIGDTEELLRKIEMRWQALGETSDEIVKQAHNDPVLLTHPQFVRQSIGPVISRATSTSPLPDLLESLEHAAADPAWNSVLAYLRSGEAKNLDHAWLIESSVLHKQFNNRSLASKEDLQTWLAEARLPEFQKLAASDDPRPRWSLRQQISRLRAIDLAKLAGMYKDAAEARAAVRPFEQKLAELDGSAAKVLASELPWSVKNRPEITSKITSIDQQLSQIVEALRGAMAKRQGELDELTAREAAAVRRREDGLSFAGKVEGMKISGNAAIQREWELRSRPVVEEIKSDPMKYGTAHAERISQIQGNLALVEDVLASLPGKLEIKAAGSAVNEKLVGALQLLDAKQRQRVLDEMLAASRDENFKAKAKEIRASYDQWAAEAGKLAADVAEAAALLAAGYSLDEAPARDRPSARQLLDRCQKVEYFSSDAIQAAIAPIVGPIRALEGADSPGLVKFAGAAERPLGLRLMAWRNLARDSNDWPAAREDLQQAMTIWQALAEAVTKGEPADRREIQLTELGRSAGNLWARFLAKASSVDDLEYALGMREKLSIAADPPDSRTRFNIALYEARRGPSKVEKSAAELQGAIEALPENLRKSGEISKLSAAIRQNKTASARADFSILGPMAARARAGTPIKWNFTSDDAGGTVTFTARISRDISPDDPEIVFKRIATDAGDVYLSTSEVSVGLFADVITAAEKWRDVAPMLWSYDAREGDPRPGPRSWEWPRYGRLTQGIRRTNVWLAGNSDHYPASLATAENRMVLKDESGRPARELNPSKRQPMQYVSPEAAVYFCEMLACRLPTPAEWKSAYRLGAKDVPNLRDRTFKTLVRWIYGPSAVEHVPPELGMFTPAGEKPTGEIWTESRITNRAAEAVDREYSDGILWFTDVAPSATTGFNHLVGNVAEMCYENGRMFAIGGSALSPPTRPIDQPFEIPNWRSGNKGYSDVGFRIAFSTPPNPTQQLAALLEKQPYLLP